MKCIKQTSCAEGAEKNRDNIHLNKKLRRRHENLRSPVWEKILVPPFVILKKFLSPPLTH